MSSIAGKRVRMFRCQIPPLFGPKPNNAHMPETYGADAYVDETVSGIIVYLENKAQHFVPFTNIQHIELYKEEQAIVKPTKIKSQAV